MVVMCVVRAGGVVREVVRSETRGGRARENMGGERGRVKACKGSQRRAAKSRYGLRYSEKAEHSLMYTHTHVHYIATLLWMKWNNNGHLETIEIVLYTDSEVK